MNSLSKHLEDLLYSTVVINTDKGIGTGFFFEYREGRIVKRFLVTNMHVISDTGNFHLYLHAGGAKDGNILPANTSKRVFFATTSIDVFEAEDPYWDLCIIPFEQIEAEATKQGLTPYIKWISSDLIPNHHQESSLAVADPVLMYGYPGGIWDENNNFPVVRRGIIASHPAKDFMWQPEILIDMTTFFGSSGSPVFLVDKSWESPILFLGIVKGSYVIDASGKPQKTSEIGDDPVNMASSTMINLGLVLKSHCISQLCADTA